MTLKCGRQAQGAGVGRATLRSRSAWSRVRAHTLCLQDEVAVDDLSKAGHVKSVRVEAFKCHDHFEVEFGCAQDQLAVLGERRAHVTEAWLGPCMLVLADFFFLSGLCGSFSAWLMARERPKAPVACLASCMTEA